MGRTCILHIGTEKTATTSFQRYFDIHRDAVLREGVWYPRSLGGQWHRWLSVFAMPPSRPDDAFEQLGLKSPDDHQRFCRELQEAFAREIETIPDPEYCLISSEHFHSRLINSQEIERVKDFLSPYFQRFVILLHLRPQIDLLTSLASTGARSRIIVDREFFEAVDLDKPYYNYDRLLGMWEAVFGKENIRVIAFRRQSDMRRVVVKETGIAVDRFGELGRQNPALDVEVIAMLNCLKREGVDLQGVGGLINALPVHEKVAPPRALAYAIQERCREGNKRVSARYPGIEIDDLEPDYDRFPEQGNLDKLDGTCSFPRGLADFFTRTRQIIKNNRTLRQKLANAGL